MSLRFSSSRLSFSPHLHRVDTLCQTVDCPCAPASSAAAASTPPSSSRCEEVAFPAPASNDKLRIHQTPRCDSAAAFADSANASGTPEPPHFVTRRYRLFLEENDKTPTCW